MFTSLYNHTQIARIYRKFGWESCATRISNRELLLTKGYDLFQYHVSLRRVLRHSQGNSRRSMSRQRTLLQVQIMALYFLVKIIPYSGIDQENNI